MERTHTIAELLRFVEREYQKKNAFNEKVGHRWVPMSHREFLSEVKELALYLNSIGIKKGDKVGIVAVSGVRWVIADLAIMSCGGITVPLFSNISEENFVFECNQTHLKTVFVRGEDSWKMVAKHRKLFDCVIALDTPPTHEKKAISYKKALAKGGTVLKKHPKLFYDLLDRIDENDVATIVYTSGSTGVPKGVVLTQKNLLATTFSNPLAFVESDRVLNILPLAHVFARVSYLMCMRWNMTLYYFNDLKNIGAAAQEVHPTVLCLVPRLLEKIYAKMVARINEQGFLKRSIGKWAFSIAMGEGTRLFRSLADKIVYKALRQAFGNDLRIVICASAPLNADLNHFFNNIGIPVFEAYGLTEAIVCTLDTPEEFKVGTLGKPYPGVEVKISSDGEILVRGDVLFKEYYKSRKATHAAIDKEGWMHTGDKGSMDEEGYTKIAGRVQELVKSSTGEWVAPVPLEQELGRAPFLEFAMVVAEGRKFVSALIFPNFEVVHALKKEQNLEKMSDEEYLNSEYILHEMNKLIEKINVHHNHWEQIHGYRFVMTPPSVEGGELNPTLKLRRSFVQKKYQDLIDSMYLQDKAKIA